MFHCFNLFLIGRINCDDIFSCKRCTALNKYKIISLVGSFSAFITFHLSTYGETLGARYLLESLLRKDAATGLQIYKSVLAIHLLHGYWTDVATYRFLFQATHCTFLIVLTTFVKCWVFCQIELGDIFHRCYMSANLISIAIRCFVKQVFYDCVLIIQFSECACRYRS